MTSETLKPAIFIFSDNSKLILAEEAIEHLAAHPEITAELLTAAASKVSPELSLENQSVLVDLPEFGLWGKSGLVKTDKISPKDTILFGFRINRSAPSRVIQAELTPTSKLTLVFRSTKTPSVYDLLKAYAALESALSEPISLGIDPTTEEGQQEREMCLEYWTRHALAIDSANLVSKTFQSTWEEVILKYGSIYHGGE